MARRLGKACFGREAGPLPSSDASTRGSHRPHPRLLRDPPEYDRHVPPRDLKIKGYVVAQFPNVPLLVAVAAALVSPFLDDGTTAADVARSVFYVALTVWAYEEAADGVNRFRKALGIAGLLFVVIRVAQGFG